jgi:hypothetical protein
MSEFTLNCRTCKSEVNASINVKLAEAYVYCVKCSIHEFVSTHDLQNNYFSNTKVVDIL